MFGRIAHRYDLANRVLSGGIDIYWRSYLVKAVFGVSATEVLDLASGSGDVAFALSRGLGPGARILGVDFCQPMVDEALRKKAAEPVRYANVAFEKGDALALGLPDGRFDAVTAAFGLRNMADRGRFFAEALRVLRPGGSLFVLEFSRPKAWAWPAYKLYLTRVLPALAKGLTGDREAYDYLAGSIVAFPGFTAIAGEMASAGFEGVRADRLTFGVVALHSGRRPLRL
ncbi:MAG TPA: ubiquinone/menaquinone biosynthesis methyltransferase, partial [Opitutaceae bacterium]